MPRRPELTVSLILSWADAHFGRTGQWPKAATSPVIDGLLGENWRRIDNALRYGLRGLPGGSSLAQLLDRHRGVRNVQDLPALTENRTLKWADHHHRRTGAWPTHESGPILAAPGEVWRNVDQALRKGGRGLPGGSSLAQLLASRLGIRNGANAPPLTIEQILDWADRHHERTGRWPRSHDGPTVGAPDETWTGIDSALVQGYRGLPGKSSLAQLLTEHRGVRNPARLPPLTLQRIREWARAHLERTGKWPAAQSGPVFEARGETWRGIEMALVKGLRGLKGGSSLARVLRKRWGSGSATATSRGGRHRSTS